MAMSYRQVWNNKRTPVWAFFIRVNSSERSRHPRLRGDDESLEYDSRNPCHLVFFMIKLMEREK